MSGSRAPDIVFGWVGTAAITVALLVVAAACGSTTVTASTSGTTGAPPGSGAGPATAPAGVAAAPGDLTFRPVLEVMSTDPTAVVPTTPPYPVGPPPADGLPPTSFVPPAPEVVLLGTGPIEQLRYALGPVAVDLQAVESADAAFDRQTGQWLVRLLLRPGDPGIDTFNRAALSCYLKQAPCPIGELAVVVDGSVLVAPTINAPSFERDRIELAAGFDQTSAEAFARRFTPH